MKFLKRIGLFFLDIIQTVTLALSVFVVIYLFLFQPHQVKGQSMYPNFISQEFLLTDKISYRFGEPKRGDVVVFKAPSTEACAEIECEYIKRIVGLPGEKIKIQEDKVFINGKVLDEPYLSSGLSTRAGHYLKEGVETKIPWGFYILLGDNRSHSRDSREFGTIAREAIVGRAFLRYWPISHAGLVANTNSWGPHKSFLIARFLSLPLTLPDS